MECRVTDLTKRFGSKPALSDINVPFESGKVTVILGPSGSGKTTLLRCIAGLESADEGRIDLDSRPVFDGARKVDVPAHERGIGMVFQSYGLWPHMTVADNIGFPLRIKRLGAADVADKIAWALEMVGLTGYGERMPGQLSGGEQQRVALARAFASEPGILLMDEPLSNLDAMLRESVRLELKDLQRRLGMTMIYITHDQDEAMALADHLIVMSRARIAQRGDAEQVYRAPADAFVARFLGTANLLSARIRSRSGKSVSLDGPSFIGEVRAAIDPASKLTEGESALLMVRPEDLVLADGETPSVWQGTIRQRVFQGSRVVYVVKVSDGTDVQVETSASDKRDAGGTVSLGLRAPEAALALAAGGIG